MRNNEWPETSGPCRVGSTACSLTDNGRTSHLLSENNGRTMLIKVWYPADEPTPTAVVRESLWRDIHDDPAVPGLMKMLLRGTRKLVTHSYLQATFSTNIKHTDILIYNHGLISFAAENTFLMEHLASNGYIVIAIQHREQLNEFKALQGVLSAAERKHHTSLQKRIQQTVEEERAELSRQYYQAASNSNAIVSARALDTGFVIENISTILETIPGINNCELNTGAIGLVGLSLGGAVATEFAKADNRGSFVVNMDGGIYGRRQDQSDRKSVV